MNGLILLATFIDLFAVVFNGLIIARIIVGLVSKPENRLFTGLVNLTEPVLAPVRKLLPAANGMDFSPTVTVILLYVIDVIVSNLLPQQ